MPFNQLVEEVNKLAEQNRFYEEFRRLREQIHRRVRMGKLFHSVKFNRSGDPYTYHRGGLEEPQLNLGYDGNETRCGIAVSFQPTQSVPDPKALRVRYEECFFSAIQAHQQQPSSRGFQLRGNRGDNFIFYGCYVVGALPTAADCVTLLKNHFSPLYKQIHDCVRSRKMSNEWQSEFEVMQALLRDFGQIVLQGPPGTSKTWTALRLCAMQLLGVELPDADNAVKNRNSQFWDSRLVDAGAGNSTSPCWDIVQFHPAYNYEDFVRGIQVTTTGNAAAPGSGLTYESVHRVFSRLCERAAQSEGPHVLIIDEINRANLAAVLGELILALEYRDTPVRTPYAVDQGDHALTVPPNLFVIGTMNTADRSVGHIDYAVRRRFAFVSLLPSRKRLESYYTGRPEILKSANTLYDAVDALFDSMDNEAPDGEPPALSPDFHADDIQPGHTYFMANDCEQLVRRFVYQLLPLLREYVKDGVLSPEASLTVRKQEIPLGAAQDHGDLQQKLRAALCGDDGLPAADDASEPEAK